MQPTPSAAASGPPVAFNAWLGIIIVLANSLLLYFLLFFYEVSENDRTLFGPVLSTLVTGQLAVLAAGSKRPWKVGLWVTAGASGVVTGLLWLGYFWLQAFARGFNH